MKHLTKEQIRFYTEITSWGNDPAEQYHRAIGNAKWNLRDFSSALKAVNWQVRVIEGKEPTRMGFFNFKRTKEMFDLYTFPEKKQGLFSEMRHRIATRKVLTQIQRHLGYFF